MSGSKPGRILCFTWKFISPTLVAIIWASNLVAYKNPTYDSGRYTFPWWGLAGGWLVALTSLLAVPTASALALTERMRTGMTFSEAFRHSLKPAIETDHEMKNEQPLLNIKA